MIDLVGKKEELKSLGRNLPNRTPILALDVRKEIDSLIIYGGWMQKVRIGRGFEKCALYADAVVEFGRAIKPSEDRIIGGSDLYVDYRGELRLAYNILSATFVQEELGMLNLVPKGEIELDQGRISYNPSMLIVGRDPVIEHLRGMFKEDLQ